MPDSREIFDTLKKRFDLSERDYDSFLEAWKGERSHVFRVDGIDVLRFLVDRQGRHLVLPPEQLSPSHLGLITELNEQLRQLAA